MKVLKSPAMRRFLAAGIRKARKHAPPGDGGMFSLVYKTLPNGWHYQVEFIHDTRRNPKPWVQVFAFAPPIDFSGRLATYTLTKEFLDA